MPLLRYFFVGAAATALHYTVLVLAVEAFDWPAAVAAALGTVCGALASYAMNRRMTFTSSSASHRQALPRFALVACLAALLNSALVWAGTQSLGWHYLAAQATATVLLLVLTYHFNRTWTFA